MMLDTPKEESVADAWDASDSGLFDVRHAQGRVCS